MKVGILGGGQLGRMLALAGYPLGMTFRFYDPGEAQAVQGLGEHIRAPWQDAAALERFSRDLDVATYEFENVPVECARAVAERVPLRPGLEPLATGQDRILEKSLFRSLAIPTPEFVQIDDRSSLDAAIGALGLPAVLKTRRDGYDGKGQHMLVTMDDVDLAWADLGGRPLILEERIDFDRELSMIAVRSEAGHEAHYPVAENTHRNGILQTSIAPAADVDGVYLKQIYSYAQALMRRMKYVGVLGLELFERSGQVLANEFAPRVHNSGHWTQDGARTSQFENQLRAVCGLPLGGTEAHTPILMTNLIGQLPETVELLSGPGTRVHLYGKSPRPGRKLGHVNTQRVIGQPPLREPRGGV